MYKPVKQLEKKFYDLLSHDVAMQTFMNDEAFAGIWFWDLEHRQHIWVSKSLEKLLGFEDNQHLKIPLSWNELLPVNDVESICRSFDDYLANNGNAEFEIEIPFIQKNHRKHFLKCKVIAVDNKSFLLGLVQVQNKNEDYRSKHFTTFPFEEKSDDLLNEIPLRNLDLSYAGENEFASKYESLIKACNLGGWEYRVDNGDLWCSKEYFELLGYRTDTIKSWEKYDVQKVWVDLLHPEDVEKATSFFNKYLTHLEGIYEQKFRMKNVNGNWVWIASKGKALKEEVEGEEVLLVIGTHSDITESKRLEFELLERNKKLLEDYALLKSIINSPKDIFIVSLDTEYRYTSFSEKYKKNTKERFGKDIYVGYKVLDLFNEAQMQKFKPAFDAALRGEYFEIEVSIPLDSGDINYMVYNYNPIKDQDGNVLGATVFIHDKTEIKKIEFEKHINELRYTNLFSGASDAIFIANVKTGMIVDANTKAIELLGYDKFELLQLNQFNLVPTELKELAKLKFNEFTSSTNFNAIEAIVQTKSGKKIPVEITTSGSFQIGGEEFSAAYFKDITNRVKISQELKKQNQQLKDIAWTQSHMVRAPLTRLMGLVNALDKGIVPESDKSVYLKYVREASNELDSVIKDITAKTVTRSL